MLHIIHTNVCNDKEIRTRRLSDFIRPTTNIAIRSKLLLIEFYFIWTTFTFCIQTLRGTSWRGKDCDDGRKSVHPGAKYVYIKQLN